MECSQEDLKSECLHPPEAVVVDRPQKVVKNSLTSQQQESPAKKSNNLMISLETKRPFLLSTLHQSEVLPRGTILN